MHRDLDRALRVASARGGGVAPVIVADDFNANHERTLAGRLEAYGYLIVCPRVCGPPGRDSAILHRHIVVNGLDDETPDLVVSWIRALSQTSPRRHLVIARARLAVHQKSKPIAEDLVSSCARLVARGQLAAAWPQLSAVLRDPRADWNLYSLAATLVAQIYVARAELTLARSCIQGVSAEAEVCGHAWPPELRACAEEVAYWLGDSSLHAPEGGGRWSAECGWSALSCWRREQTARLALLRARLATRVRDDHVAAYWTSLFDVISGTPRTELPRQRIVALAKWAMDVRLPARARSLAAAVAGRAWKLQNATGEACRTFGLVRHVGPEQQLVSALSGGARSRLAGVESLVIDQTNGRSADSVCTLLHQLEGAEDEAAALSVGCHWVQRHGDNPAVGIVSSDRQRLVAAAGWKTADLSDEVVGILKDAVDGRGEGTAIGLAVPIRYGGAPLGWVVVKGAPTDRPALEQAAQTLAAVCGSALRARLDALSLRERDRDCAPEILGNSPSIADVRAAIARAAGTTFPVLIEGESGTGKELVARALHRLSPRRDRRFVAVNCAALTDELVEAELFGHARGAFTGAVGARSGLFEEASGGTLFLDEVTELSARAQAKLLRVLQEREIRRVGENAARRIDIRIIAATNLALGEAVSAGRFRDDLRFRLAVVKIRLPALRDRLEDLPILTHVLWRRALADTGKRAVLGADVLACLGRHNWPGNVRELQNVIAGLAVAAPARGRVTKRHVSQVIGEFSATDEATPVPLERARHLFERRLVAAALARHAGRRTAAAVDLGLTRQGLAKALRRLGLEAEPEEAGVA